MTFRVRVSLFFCTVVAGTGAAYTKYNFFYNNPPKPPTPPPIQMRLTNPVKMPEPFAAQIQRMKTRSAKPPGDRGM